MERLKKNNHLKSAESSHILSKFPNEPTRPSIEKGDGVNLYLKGGKKLLDATSGWTSFAILGYSHKKVLEAMHAQMRKYCHIDYNIWSSEILEEVARLLVSRTPEGLDKVYFSGTSGSEAVEAAMKLSFQVHQASGNTKKNHFIHREQSFSGATLQAMSVSDQTISNFYDPIKPNNTSKISEHNAFHGKHENESLDEYAKRGALELEEKILAIGPENVCAFVGETMLGSLRGEVPPAPHYWQYIRKVCDKFDVHIILDEIYCGSGRSGKIYCCEYDNFCPDFICIGKGCAAGYAPISAVITRSCVENIIASDSGRIQLGHTFQGYSLGAAAMVAVQKIIHDDEMLENICADGRHIRETLQYELGSHEFFRETRGRGLNSAIEYDCVNTHLFSIKIHEIMQEDHSILINSKWNRTTFALPFIMPRNKTDQILEKYVATFRKVASSWSAGSFS